MPHELLGLKAAPALAGFVGGVISLAFMQSLSLTGKVLSVLGGMFAAGYFSPLIVHYVADSMQHGPGLENAIAFLTGLVGMNFLAGIYKVSLALRENPASVIDILKGRGKDDSHDS
jgi:hypothetical protein